MRGARQQPTAVLRRGRAARMVLPRMVLRKRLRVRRVCVGVALLGASRARWRGLLLVRSVRAARRLRLMVRGLCRHHPALLRLRIQVGGGPHHALRQHSHATAGGGDGEHDQQLDRRARLPCCGQQPLLPILLPLSLHLSRLPQGGVGRGRAQPLGALIPAVRHHRGPRPRLLRCGYPRAGARGPRAREALLHAARTARRARQGQLALHAPLPVLFFDAHPIRLLRLRGDAPRRAAQSRHPRSERWGERLLCAARAHRDPQLCTQRLLRWRRR
mmetsp:Transcript_9083/g.28757  ORF Transcript_9083/g.28757 Transcript_9083/m.28757 type:complete len:273 (+) Transcript_9083:314-1132(+)